MIAGNNIGVGGAGLAFGGTMDSSATSQLIAIDPDNSDTQIQYKILTNTVHGKLSLNGAVLGVGSTFTQDDLNLVCHWIRTMRQSLQGRVSLPTNLPSR